MGKKPILEKSNRTPIPDDGRITIGDEYAHRLVPVEIDVPAPDDEQDEDGPVFDFYTVDKFEADSRGRITLPAPVQENHNVVFWAVSEPALEHGSLGEAWEAHRKD